MRAVVQRHPEEQAVGRPPRGGGVLEGDHERQVHRKQVEPGHRRHHGPANARADSQARRNRRGIGRGSAPARSRACDRRPGRPGTSCRWPAAHRTIAGSPARPSSRPHRPAAAAPAAAGGPRRGHGAGRGPPWSRRTAPWRSAVGAGHRGRSPHRTDSRCTSQAPAGSDRQPGRGEVADDHRQPAAAGSGSPGAAVRGRAAAGRTAAPGAAPRRRSRAWPPNSIRRGTAASPGCSAAASPTTSSTSSSARW